VKLRTSRVGVEFTFAPGAELGIRSQSPLLGKGGVAAPSIKMSRRHLIWRGRGGSFKQPRDFLTNTTPSAPLIEAARFALALRAKEASRHFFDGAATPPQLRRGLASLEIISRHSFAAPRLLLAAYLLLLPACRQQMADQPRYNPLGESAFFPDHRSARPLPIGVVALWFLDEDDHLYAGRVDGKLATTFPFDITADVLARGRERYEIFCTPCHDQVGTGNGMAVRRGFRRGPPSFHTDRLREAPLGH